MGVRCPASIRRPEKGRTSDAGVALGGGGSTSPLSARSVAQGVERPRETPIRGAGPDHPASQRQAARPSVRLANRASRPRAGSRRAAHAANFVAHRVGCAARPIRRRRASGSAVGARTAGTRASRGTSRTTAPRGPRSAATAGSAAAARSTASTRTATAAGPARRAGSAAAARSTATAGGRPASAAARSAAARCLDVARPTPVGWLVRREDTDSASLHENEGKSYCR
jgi:hypothetical protein